MIHKIAGTLSALGLFLTAAMSDGGGISPAQSLFAGLICLLGLVVSVEYHWYSQLNHKQKRDRPQCCNTEDGPKNRICNHNVQPIDRFVK